MATLEKIRSKAGLLVIVVGIALFAFIIGDFLRSGSTFFSQSKEKIITVDGNSIGIREYQNRVEYLTNAYKNSGNVSEDQQYQIREAVYREMVNDILLKESGKKTGMTVGSDELSDLILGNNISPVIQQIPDFQNPQTGQFDKNSFIQFLQVVESDDLSMYPVESQRQIMEMKQYWMELEKNVINQQITNKLASFLTSAIAYNSLDTRKQFQETSVSVDFEYVSQNFSSIPDSAVNVSNAEISKLYEERKENFKQNESKIIDYIAVHIVPSQNDYTEIAKDLEGIKQELAENSNVTDIVNENSDAPFVNAYATTAELSPEILEFVKAEPAGSVYGPVLTGDTYQMSKFMDTKQSPDSVFMYILTLPAFNDEALLTNFSDSLIRIIKGGKAFSEMAMEATSGQGNGELGWQTEYSMMRNGADERIVEAAFSAKLKEPQVVKSTFGTHLIQITEQTKPTAKYKMANIIVNVTPSTETYNNLYNELNQFISKNNNGNAFRENATEANFFIQADIPVTENQNSLASIGNSRQVVRWAFDNKKGNVSDIFECDDYFVAAAVAGATKEGYRPLTEVSDILKRELTNKKKGEKIVADLKAKNISSLEQYAEEMNSTVQNTQFVTFNTSRITGIGADPTVNAEAISAEVGTITGPFAGTNAVYVLSLTDKRLTDEQSYNEETIKAQFQMQNSYRLGQMIQSGALLQENAKIEDHRSRFF